MTAPTSLATEVLPYLLSVIGFLVVYVLYGIKSEIREVRTSVNALEGELRSGIGTLDRRVTVMETRCAGEHGHPMVGEKC